MLWRTSVQGLTWHGLSCRALYHFSVPSSRRFVRGRCRRSSLVEKGLVLPYMLDCGEAELAEGQAAAARQLCRKIRSYEFKSQLKGCLSSPGGTKRIRSYFCGELPWFFSISQSHGFTFISHWIHHRFTIGSPFGESNVKRW